jgi:hypothetical protein
MYIDKVILMNIFIAPGKFNSAVHNWRHENSTPPPRLRQTLALHDINNIMIKSLRWVSLIVWWFVYSLFVRNHAHLVLFALPEVPVQNVFGLDVEI